jgi:hypothetical protein
LKLSTWLFTRNFRNYKELYIHEREAIIDYMEYNDSGALTDIIQHIDDITPAMRTFIADIVAGKLKRKNRKKPSTFKRDKILHRFVKEHLAAGHKLTSGRVDGATALVSEGTGESEDTILKAFQRIENHNNKSLNELAKEEQHFKLFYGKCEFTPSMT